LVLYGTILYGIVVPKAKKIASIKTVERSDNTIIEKTRGGFLISQLNQIQGRIFEKLLKKHGIDDFNGPQGRILFVLWQNDDLPISEVGSKTSLSKSTLTSMLDRMEQQGHIKRNYDPHDRRLIRITLTQKAKALHQQYIEVSAEMNHIFYQGFSDEKVVVFEKILAEILDNLKQYERGQ
jgi:DNA-binding MarR family transcriptional regulator